MPVLLDMADMGYGLTIEDVKMVAYRIVAGSGRSHLLRKVPLVMIGMKAF